MDLENLKTKLRKFSKDRDWEKFHSPKNIAIALSVEASELFKKYLSSPLYAFGGAASPSIVSKDEKELYWKIFSELELACKVALKNSGYSEQFYVKAKNYSKERGVRGHRPKDLWCAIRNKNSETFNEMPQIYIIASDRGIEAGFAVSIPESDYSNMNVKMRNREIIPRINKKLPIEGPELEKLDELFANNKNCINLKQD